MINCNRTRVNIHSFLFFSFLFFFAGLSQATVTADLLWMEDSGFLGDSSEQVLPAQRFQRARNLFFSQEYSRALTLLNRVRSETDSRDLFNRASLLRAKALYHEGSFIDSYRAFKRFFRRNPGAESRNLVVRYQIDIGFQLMKGKDYRRVLGIPLLSAAWAGEQIVRTLMSRFPYKPFSDTYQYRLANLYFNRENYETAAEEYKFLLEQYEQSNWLSNAQFLAGECFFRTVEDLSYDTSNLSKARDHFRTYVQEYPDASKVEKAKQRLRKISVLQAERRFNTADWYERTGRPSGAVTYYLDIIRLYPGTEWAGRALTRLENLEADVPEANKKRVRDVKNPRILQERGTK